MKAGEIIKRCVRFVAFVVVCNATSATAQSTLCSDRLNFQPATTPNAIGWQKFPEFRLPFPVVYGGPRLNEPALEPLRHGFSHLTVVRPDEGPQMTPARQAIEFYGLAYGLNQPWETLESPWGNDLNAYRAKWDQWLRDHSAGQNAAGKWVPGFTVLMVDIERVLETDAQILRLKTNTQTPADLRQLPDAQFLERYKRDMTTLYADAVRYLRERADFSNVRVTSYSDVPIRNTYLNVVGNTWQDWSTNVARTSFLFRDPATGQPGGPFAEQLDFLQPSGYYYYDYPSPLAPDYLAYLLFQVEANRAWSQKPVWPIVWMRYHDCCGSHPKFIQPFMAEATAIFPFFSGARGLWLWEVPNFRDAERPMAAYEHFIHGLYRLSKFSEMFEGTYELVIATPARDLMDKHLPVWRGVFKANKLLIAAQNPYAADGAQTTVEVSYKNWSTTITLTGREVYLCQYDLSLTGLEPAPLSGLTISPNPALTKTTLTFNALGSGTVDVQLLDVTGRLVKQQSLQTSPGRMRLDLDTASLPAGLYIVRLLDGKTAVQEKLMIE